jgi:hypothetical protein
MPSYVVVPSRRHRTWPWSGPTTAIKDIALLQSDHHRGSKCGRCTAAFKQYARGEHSLVIIAILANSSIRQWQHSSTTGSATCLTKIPASELHARHQARHRCSHAIMQPPSCITGCCRAWSCLDHRDQLSHLDGAIFFVISSGSSLGPPG